MRLIPIATFACAAIAQTLVPPADIQDAAKALEARAGEKNLHCALDPIKPSLNFGLRFQAGFRLGVPLAQYSGGARQWTTTLRVTPNVGEPRYLRNRADLPAASHPEFTAEMTGTFLLGEGRYHAELALADDLGRVCRKEWQIAAALDRSERSIQVAMPAGAVADLSYDPPHRDPAGPPAPRRITVLMNSSPPYQLGRRGRVQPGFVPTLSNEPSTWITGPRCWAFWPPWWNGWGPACGWWYSIWSSSATSSGWTGSRCPT